MNFNNNLKINIQSKIKSREDNLNNDLFSFYLFYCCSFLICNVSFLVVYNLKKLINYNREITFILHVVINKLFYKPAVILKKYLQNRKTLF